MTTEQTGDLTLQVNSSFSLKSPFLQLAWDSTSLGLLKTCAQKYYLAIVGATTPLPSGALAIAGYASRQESAHLTFGLLYHGALERFDHAKANGASHDEAIKAAVHWAAKETWNKELRRPWISDLNNKNRLTLIRTVVWYCDQFRDDPASTVILANGRPAVELSFRFATQVYADTGEEYMVCGHLDRMVEFQGLTYVMDRKTTGNTLNSDFFKKFSPDNQFSLYSFAGKVVYELPMSGLICDAAQVAVTFSRFERGFITRTEDQLQEWWQHTMYWIAQAERFAAYGAKLAAQGKDPSVAWPMNDSACHHYGGCQFREICSKSPKVRKQWLEGGAVRKVWDPLQVRGDI